LSGKLRFRCPDCSKVLAASVEKAGKKAKCPGCSKILTIPRPKSKAAAGAPAPPSNEAADNAQPNFRFLDGFSHLPKFNPISSQGYDLSAGDHSVVLQEKAKLLRANIEIDDKERASYWRARLWSRFFAFLIDYVIVSVPVSLILWMTGRTAEMSSKASSIAASFSSGTFDAALVKELFAASLPGWLLFALLWVIYQGLLVAFTGTTVGGMATKVMSVNRDLNPVGLGRAFARGAAYILSLWVPLLFIVGFFTVGNRMVHDLMAGTLVSRSSE